MVTTYSLSLQWLYLNSKNWINRNPVISLGNFPWCKCAFEFRKEIWSINHGGIGDFFCYLIFISETALYKHILSLYT